MKFKYNLLIILFLIHSTFYSQNNKKVIFTDEDNKETSLVNYYKKCNSFLFKCKKEENDSIIINKTTQFFKFGKLTNYENKQLRNLLFISTKNNNVLSNTLVISHREKLLGYNDLKKTLNDEYLLFFNEKNYNLNNKKKDSKRKNCKKLTLRNNAVPLFTYSNNINYNYKPRNFNWLKESRLSNIIFNHKSGILILNKNGEYFLNQGYLDNDYVQKLLKNHDWSKFKNDYEQALSQNLKKRNVFFSLDKKKLPNVVFVDSKNSSSKHKVRKALKNISFKNYIIRDSRHKKIYLNEIKSRINSKCFSNSFNN